VESKMEEDNNKDDWNNKKCRYEMETIADEYIWNILNNVRWLDMDYIREWKRMEVIDNYREYVAMNQGLCPGEITQGVNEINLAIDIYNIKNALGSRN
jgi:hypothetical protein